MPRQATAWPVERFRVHVATPVLAPRVIGNFVESMLDANRCMTTPCTILDLAAMATSLSAAGSSSALLLRLLERAQLLRLARFGRFSIAIRALVKALRRRCFEPDLFLALAVIILIASGILIYHVEGAYQPDAFGRIPRALWWSVAPLTTVGSGGVYLVTAIVHSVAWGAAIVAIGFVAMPAGILAAGFTDAFQHHQGEQRPWSTCRDAPCAFWPEM